MQQPPVIFEHQIRGQQTPSSSSSSIGIVDESMLAPLEEPSTIESVLHDCGDFYCEVAKLILFFVGTIGNILALLVMRQQAANARSYTLTLTVLTSFNSLTLFALGLDSFDHLLSKHYGSFESYIGDLGCKLYRMFPHVTQMASHWLVVFVTAERFCAICFPLNHRLGRFFTLRGTRVILTCLLIAVFASQTWRLAFDYQEAAYESETDYNETATVIVMVPAECTAREMATYFVIDSFVNQLLLLSLLPALAILVLNSATAYTIARSGRDLRRIMSNASNLSSILASHSQQQEVEQGLSQFNTFMAAAKRLTLSPSMANIRLTLSRSPSVLTTANGGMASSPSNLDIPRPIISPSPSSYYNGGGSSADARRSTKFRTRKSTVLLLTLTGCFLICLTPQLAILIYLRLYHLIYGHAESFKAFVSVCRALNFASVLTAMNYADNFFIFLIAGRGFRKAFVDRLTSSGWLRRCANKIILRHHHNSDGTTPRSSGETGRRFYDFASSTTAGSAEQQQAGMRNNNVIRSNSCSYRQRTTSVETDLSANAGLLRNNSVCARPSSNRRSNSTRLTVNSNSLMVPN